MRRLHAAGQLDGPAALFFREVKPVEELYDTDADPYEINNLAGDPKYKETLEAMRAAHLKWARDVKDLGLLPEPELLSLRDGYNPPSEWAILRDPGNANLAKRLYDAVTAGWPGVQDTKTLVGSLDAPEPAVRYWAITGLSHLEEPGPATIERITAMLCDESACVRVAAADTLANHAHVERALTGSEQGTDFGRPVDSAASGASARRDGTGGEAGAGRTQEGVRRQAEQVRSESGGTCGGGTGEGRCGEVSGGSSRVEECRGTSVERIPTTVVHDWIRTSCGFAALIGDLLSGPPQNANRDPSARI